MVSQVHWCVAVLAPKVQQFLSIVFVCLAFFQSSARAQDGLFSNSDGSVSSFSDGHRLFSSSDAFYDSTTVIYYSSEDLSSAVDTTLPESPGSTTPHLYTSGIVDTLLDTTAGLPSTLSASSHLPLPSNSDVGTPVLSVLPDSATRALEPASSRSNSVELHSRSSTLDSTLEVSAAVSLTDLSNSQTSVLSSQFIPNSSEPPADVMSSSSIDMQGSARITPTSTDQLITVFDSPSQGQAVHSSSTDFVESSMTSDIYQTTATLVYSEAMQSMGPSGSSSHEQTTLQSSISASVGSDLAAESSIQTETTQVDEVEVVTSLLSSHTQQVPFFPASSEFSGTISAGISSVLDTAHSQLDVSKMTDSSLPAMDTSAPLSSAMESSSGFFFERSDLHSGTEETVPLDMSSNTADLMSTVLSSELLLSHTSLVSSETELFSGTIRDTELSRQSSVPADGFLTSVSDIETSSIISAVAEFSSDVLSSIQSTAIAGLSLTTESSLYETPAVSMQISSSEGPVFGSVTDLSSSSYYTAVLPVSAFSEITASISGFNSESDFVISTIAPTPTVSTFALIQPSDSDGMSLASLSTVIHNSQSVSDSPSEQTEIPTVTPHEESTLDITPSVTYKDTVIVSDHDGQTFSGESTMYQTSLETSYSNLVDSSLLPVTSDAAAISLSSGVDLSSSYFEDSSRVTFATNIYPSSVLASDIRSTGESVGTSSIFADVDTTTRAMGLPNTSSFLLESVIETTTPISESILSSRYFTSVASAETTDTNSVDSTNVFSASLETSSFMTSSVLDGSHTLDVVMSSSHLANSLSGSSVFLQDTSSTPLMLVSQSTTPSSRVQGSESFSNYISSSSENPTSMTYIESPSFQSSLPVDSSSAMGTAESSIESVSSDSTSALDSMFLISSSHMTSQTLSFSPSSSQFEQPPSTELPVVTLSETSKLTVSQTLSFTEESPQTTITQSSPFEYHSHLTSTLDVSVLDSVEETLFPSRTPSLHSEPVSAWTTLSNIDTGSMYFTSSYASGSEFVSSLSGSFQTTAVVSSETLQIFSSVPDFSDFTMLTSMLPVTSSNYMTLSTGISQVTDLSLTVVTSASPGIDLSVTSSGELVSEQLSTDFSLSQLPTPSQTFSLDRSVPPESVSYFPSSSMSANSFSQLPESSEILSLSAINTQSSVYSSSLSTEDLSSTGPVLLSSTLIAGTESFINGLSSISLGSEVSSLLFSTDAEMLPSESITSETSSIYSSPASDMLRASSSFLSQVASTSVNIDSKTFLPSATVSSEMSSVVLESDSISLLSDMSTIVTSEDVSVTSIDTLATPSVLSTVLQSIPDTGISATISPTVPTVDTVSIVSNTSPGTVLPSINVSEMSSSTSMELTESMFSLPESGSLLSSLVVSTQSMSVSLSEMSLSAATTFAESMQPEETSVMTTSLESSDLTSTIVPPHTFDTLSVVDSFTVTEHLPDSLLTPSAVFTVSDIARPSQLLSSYPDSMYTSGDSMFSTLSLTTVESSEISDLVSPPVSGDSTITLSMQSSEIVVTSSFLFSDLLSPVLSHVSQSSDVSFSRSYLSHSEEALSATIVPSQSFTSDQSSSEVLPTTVPSQSLSSDIELSTFSALTSSVSSQPDMFSSETPPSTVVPVETTSASFVQSNTDFIMSVSSTELFPTPETRLSSVLSSPAQTDMTPLPELSLLETSSASSEFTSTSVITPEVTQTVSKSLSSFAETTASDIFPGTSTLFSSERVSVSAVTNTFSTMTIDLSFVETTTVSPLFSDLTVSRDSSVETTLLSSESTAVSLQSSSFVSPTELVTSSHVVLDSEMSSASSMENTIFTLTPVSSSFPTEVLPTRTPVASVTLSMESTILSSSEVLPVQSSMSTVMELPSSLLVQTSESLVTEMPSSLSVQTTELSASENLSTLSVENTEFPASDILSSMPVQSTEFPTSDFSSSVPVQSTELPTSDFSSSVPVQSTEFPTSDFSSSVLVQSTEFPTSDFSSSVPVQSTEFPTSDFSSSVPVQSTEFPTSNFSLSMSVQSTELPTIEILSSSPVQTTESLVTDFQSTLSPQSSESFMSTETLVSPMSSVASTLPLQGSVSSVTEILSTLSSDSSGSSGVEMSSSLTLQSSELPLSGTLSTLLTQSSESTVVLPTLPVQSSELFTTGVLSSLLESTPVTEVPSTVPVESSSSFTSEILSTLPLPASPSVTSEILPTLSIQSSLSVATEILSTLPLQSSPSVATEILSTLPLQSSPSVATEILSTLPLQSSPSVATEILSTLPLPTSLSVTTEIQPTLSMQSSPSVATEILSTLPVQSSESMISEIPSAMQSSISSTYDITSVESSLSSLSESLTSGPFESVSSPFASSTDFIEPSQSLIFSVPPSSEPPTISTEAVSTAVISTSGSSQFLSSLKTSLTQTLSIIVPPSVSVTTLFSSIEVLVTTSEIITETSSVPPETLDSVSSTIQTESSSFSVVESTSEVVLDSSSAMLDSSAVSSIFDTSGSVGPSSLLETFSVSIFGTTDVIGTVTETLSLGTESVITTSLMASSDVMMTSVILSSEIVMSTSSDISSTSVTESSSEIPTALSSAILPTPSLSSEVVSLSTTPVPVTTPVVPTATPTTEPPTTPASTAPGTTEPTAPPATSTPPVPENLLVVTVIRLQSQDNITSPAFLTDMEEGLARAYDIAFQRQRNGGLSPSRRKRFAAMLSLVHLNGIRGRVKRAIVNDVEVKITDASLEQNNPSNAELTYTVKDNGQDVPATQASAALDTLMDQELALELDRVVVTKARPAGQTSQPASGDDKKLWIIGAVLGPVLVLALVWVLVCVLVRHRASKKDKLHIDNNQPHLLTVKHGGTRGDGEVADDPEYAQATPGQSNSQSNGRMSKASQHKMKYEVNPDPDATVTSSGRDSSSTRTPTKKGRKLPKKKASLNIIGESEGDNSSEKVSERSTPPRKKSSKKPSYRETDAWEKEAKDAARKTLLRSKIAEGEMEMSPLDPGFFNTATLQATRQLYAQQTFEEEDEDFLENMEEERRKNKHRQRLKKKQESAQPPPVDATQAAYERAQKEIDQVLGPRQSSTEATPGVIVGDRDKRRPKKRSKRGQVNEGYSEDNEVARPSGSAPGIPPSESLEEMKHRVHALLDDAFSLISNSYSSIGSAVSERSRSFRRNRVAPATSSKEDTTQAATEQSLAKSPRQGNMPEVEEVRSNSLAPKPGEKLHTPIQVDRTYSNYDADGLITWSPYRAADESARIVLPERQVPSAKAAAQEKLQTTTFMESATAGSSGHQPNGYFATQPGQPIVIRTQQLTESSPPPKTDAHSSSEDNAEKGTQELSATANTGYSDMTYPGLQTYEDALAENASTKNTTTAHFTATPNTSSGESFMDKKPPTGANGDTSHEPDPPAHKPPSRNVGTRDERDFISSSLAAGTSPKDLVDSLRQELKSMSSKLSEAKEANGVQASTHREPGSKPTKKPRKSSYLDS